MEIKCMYITKILVFWRFHQTAGFFCVNKNKPKKVKGIKISCIKFLYENGNTEKHILNRKVWLCLIKLMADTYLSRQV